MHLLYTTCYSTIQMKSTWLTARPPITKPTLQIQEFPLLLIDMWQNSHHKKEE